MNPRTSIFHFSRKAPHLSWAIGALLLLLAGLEPLSPPEAEATPFRTRMRVQMGALTEITVPEPDYTTESVSRAFDVIERLDRLLSTYRDDSEVMRLAREGRLTVSPETLEITVRSIELIRRTDGAFNPLVAPLVSLWKDAAKSGRLPADAVLEHARALARPENISVDRAASAIAFAEPGVALDFGAIGKGYAVDQAVQSLEQDGLGIALVASGGSSHRLLGHPPGGCWEIGIRHPDDPDRAVAWLRLGASGVATSSAQGQWVEIQGQRYGHILDPRTGYPAAPPDPVWSATVIGGEATTPDAVATAVVVMGAARGKALVQSMPGLHALLTLRGEDGSPEFEATPGLSEIGVMEGLPLFVLAGDPNCGKGASASARPNRPESYPLP